MQVTKGTKLTPRLLTLTALLVCGAALLTGVFAFCADRRSPNIRVQFVDSRVGWIVGPRLLRTTDGGRTWSAVRSEGYGTFEVDDIGFGHHVIQFVNAEVGVQLDLNAVARTSDGGRTWSEKLPLPNPAPAGQNRTPQSLFFLSPEVGWVVGEVVYRTSDGGRSWEQLSWTPRGDAARQRGMRVAPTIADFTPALWFIDKENGLMARLDGELYRTDDGGRTWKMVWRADKSIAGVFFIDGQHGWVVGGEGLVARTTDGGHTWSPSPTPTKAHLTSVFFVNKRVGCAVGYGGTILSTKDGGMTWKQASVSGLWTPSPLVSVSFADESHGWAVGGNGDPMTPSLTSPSNVILTTDDGGQSWRIINP